MNNKRTLTDTHALKQFLLKQNYRYYCLLPDGLIRIEDNYILNMFKSKMIEKNSINNTLTFLENTCVY